MKRIWILLMPVVVILAVLAYQRIGFWLFENKNICWSRSEKEIKKVNESAGHHLNLCRNDRIGRTVVYSTRDIYGGVGYGYTPFNQDMLWYKVGQVVDLQNTNDGTSDLILRFKMPLSKKIESVKLVSAYQLENGTFFWTRVSEEIVDKGYVEANDSMKIGMRIGDIYSYGKLGNLIRKNDVVIVEYSTSNYPEFNQDQEVPIADRIVFRRLETYAQK